MGEPAAGLSARAALDTFFASYYRLRPVTATFTGVHEYDSVLPNWSRDGLDAAVDDMRALRRTLGAAGCPPDQAVRQFPDDVDLALADGFLEIQIAEHQGSHFYRGNAALWTGEAIFSVLALLTRDFAPLADRLECAVARLDATPGFLDAARATLVAARLEWNARAERECAVAATLFGEALPHWATKLDVPTSTRDRFADASARASRAYQEFATFLSGRGGSPTFALRASADRSDPPLRMLLQRGHWIDTSPESLLVEARDTLETATARLEVAARPHGGWLAVHEALARLHPTVDEYLQRFHDIRDACQAAAEAYDLVTWPDAPIRYVPIPEHTRAAAPQLYYLFYRAPATFDRVQVYDYVVPPIDRDMPVTMQEERLRATNDSVIKVRTSLNYGF